MNVTHMDNEKVITVLFVIVKRRGHLSLGRPKQTWEDNIKIDSCYRNRVWMWGLA